MTEHDGKEKFLEGEPLYGTIELSKTHGGKLFRLGVFLLAALMLLSLPLVERGICGLYASYVADGGV